MNDRLMKVVDVVAFAGIATLTAMCAFFIGAFWFFLGAVALEYLTGGA